MTAALLVSWAEKADDWRRPEAVLIALAIDTLTAHAITATVHLALVA